MKKTLATILLTLFPVIAYASIAVPWSATSTGYPYISPTPVNGKSQSVLIKGNSVLQVGTAFDGGNPGYTLNNLPALGTFSTSSNDQNGITTINTGSSSQSASCYSLGNNLSTNQGFAGDNISVFCMAGSNWNGNPIGIPFVQANDTALIASNNDIDFSTLSTDSGGGKFNFFSGISSSEGAQPTLVIDGSDNLTSINSNTNISGNLNASDNDGNSIVMEPNNANISLSDSNGNQLLFGGPDTGGIEANTQGGDFIVNTAAYEGTSLLYGQGRFGTDTPQLFAPGDSYWAPAHVGLWSFSAGYDNEASGISSIALGAFSRATGDGSVAGGGGGLGGTENIASGIASFAFGNEAQAGGYTAIAMGHTAKAPGYESISLGNETSSNFDNTVSIGSFNTSGLTNGGQNAVTLGNNLDSSATSSFSIGEDFSNNIAHSLELGFGEPDLIVKSGFVGVGTTSPSQQLSVFGTILGDNLILSSTTASSTFYNGVNLTKGCYAVLGTCLSTGGTPGGSSGQVQYNASGSFGAVATSSETCTSPLSCTAFNHIGSGGAISLGTVGVANGGTGQTSFGQGWLNSDGTTITSSTSPTVVYVTATSSTATSSFAGGIRGPNNFVVQSSSGFVGIGTSSPMSPFGVQGPSTPTGGGNLVSIPAMAFYAGNGTSAAGTPGTSGGGMIIQLGNGANGTAPGPALAGGAGGAFTLNAGNSGQASGSFGGSNSAGFISLIAGNGNTGNIANSTGGDITLTAGNSNSVARSGNINLTPGTSSGGGATGIVVITGKASLSGALADSASSVGTSNQVLSSTGSATQWKSVATALSATSTGSYRNQAATVSSVNTFTPTASSTYQISVSATVDSVTIGTLTVTCTYTNTNGVSSTATFFPMGLTTAALSTTGSPAFSPLIITPMKNTAITVLSTVTGTLSYDIDASIIPVGTATL